MGRRERTREALRTAALALFAEHGYDATTTAQIAARAGVSEMTLFRHFATKDSLVLDDPYDPAIAAAIRSRPTAEPPLRATIKGIGAAWRAITPAEAEVLRTRLRILAEAQTVRGLPSSTARTESAIADALVARGAAELEAKVVAAAVLAGLITALLAWATTNGDLATMINGALRALDGGRDA